MLVPIGARGCKSLVGGEVTERYPQERGTTMRCNVSYDALMVLVQAAGAGEVSPEVSEALSEARRAIRHTCERFGA